MISIDQLERGIACFVDRDMLPKMSGWKRLAAGVYAGIAVKNVGNMIRKNRDNDFIKFLSVVDGDMIDIEKVRDALRMNLKDGFEIEVLDCKYRFEAEDVDCLYNRIMEVGA